VVRVVFAPRLADAPEVLRVRMKICPCEIAGDA
jgi:hypothetical protein